MRPLILALALATACSSAPPPEAIPDPEPVAQDITGVITEVRFDGAAVVGFVVETREGSQDILIDPERDYGFNLRHLEIHEETGDPVLVKTEVRSGRVYAIAILDA